ncbi:MAG: hypothetical protein AB1641_03690 [Thermodesulfobacteriota bacterium]
MSSTVAVKVERGTTWAETVNRVKDALLRQVNLRENQIMLVPNTYYCTETHISMSYRVSPRIEK